MKHPHHNSSDRQVRHLKIKPFQDDTSTPSGDKRRGKPRRKTINITGLIKSGLTDGYWLAHNFPVPHWTNGRDNLCKGVNTPRSLLAAFLCVSYYAALCRLFPYDGLLWALERVAGSFTQFITPNPTRRPCRDKHDRRITSLSKGVTA